MQTVNLEASWKKVLAPEFEKEYWKSLSEKVRGAYLEKKVYPAPRNVFAAFDLCPFDKVKVVILGQDPYHGAGQAIGLSFAVSEGVTPPPSLKNIYKEIKADLGVEPYASGDLSRWAGQGVLLLNSVLTVEAGQPASHKGQGWEEFTSAVITALNEHKKYVVYMLWGKYAQEKGSIVDFTENLILTSGHPSPYSAHLFHGQHHFSQCNEYLQKHGITPIDWR
jgi:uracil-DNA glycosylase